VTWNPFAAGYTARTYTRARPDYHPYALDTAVRVLSLSPPVGVIVDVGCGTGMSSRAARRLADRVIGVEVSQQMLAVAAKVTGLAYVRAVAESLPCHTRCADLVIAAAAFHWFDQPRMLDEAFRVLRPGGGLVVYTDFFTGEIEGHPQLREWLAGTYLPRYPTPGRRSRFDEQLARNAGFEKAGDAALSNVVAMTPEGLADYMLTQSNATSAVDDGRTTPERMRAWLVTELETILPPGKPLSLQFGGNLWACRKPA
jgi:SAM-dependent methyltransferase